ncbi:MAG TPA: DUF5317 family protein [Dehalococcoidia bacterium]|nr:DUF5317 family protein [Dehalococcoidia bacterium]
MSLWYYLAAPVVVLAARVLWQKRPGFLTCCLFWIVAFLIVVVLGWVNAPSQYLLALGIASNATVTLINGGFMPVSAHRKLTGPARALWVQRTTSQRLTFLGDNFGNNAFRFSIGDVLLLFGIIVSFAGY